MHRYALGCSTCCRSRLAGWKTAGEFEAARVEAGIGKRALRTARERLLADGAIEKGRDGFQGPYRYRRAERAAVAESLAPESEAAPGPEAAASPAAPEAPEIPERFAATLRVLAGAPMAAAEIHPLALAMALDTLARDCGYSLPRVPLGAGEPAR